MRRVLFALVAAFVSVPVPAIEPLLRGDPGTYGGGVFVLGVDRKGIISGTFADGECSFYFFGNLESTGYRINAWDVRTATKSVIQGELRFREHQQKQGFY